VYVPELNIQQPTTCDVPKKRKLPKTRIVAIQTREKLCTWVSLVAYTLLVIVVVLGLWVKQRSDLTHAHRCTSFFVSPPSAFTVVFKFPLCFGVCVCVCTYIYAMG